MDQTPTPTSPPEPEPKKEPASQVPPVVPPSSVPPVPPVTEPTPSVDPPPSPASPAWTPDMAVDPSTSGSPDSYISNPFGLVKPSWKAVKLNLLAFLVPIFAFLILVIGIGGSIAAALVAFKFTPESFSNPGTLVTSIILGLLVLVGLIIISIIFAPYPVLVAQASLRSQKVEIIQTLKQSIKYSLRFLIIAFWVGLPLIIGLGALLLLLIPIYGMVGSGNTQSLSSNPMLSLIPIILIPGMLVAVIWTVLRSVWYSLAAYILVEKDITAKEAIAQSRGLVKGHFVETVGLIVLPNALGIIPVIGFIASIALGIIIPVAMFIRYHQLQQLQVSGGPKPAVHWANYAVIVLALLSGAFNNRNSTDQNQDLDLNNPSIEQSATNSADESVDVIDDNNQDNSPAPE